MKLVCAFTKVVRDMLNASGKMIDVISQVEGTKERIPAQIGVDKGGRVGYPRLNILVQS